MRPVTYLLMDGDRIVGQARTAPCRSGERVEYGWREDARELPDGTWTGSIWHCEGIARLSRAPRAYSVTELRLWQVS